jgi:uncharacterized flavoprotein (TIGR03862 family)
VLAESGLSVHVFDAMPSAGRKFLLAGRGGLNLTHSEPFEPFLARYGSRSEKLREALTAMDGPAIQRWAQTLGVTTFVGSSGRVFPSDMKAAPLLRAWLQRLRSMGVRFHMRHRWLGCRPDAQCVDLRFAHGDDQFTLRTRVCILALGGASWKRLGSDGAWWPLLQSAGVDLATLQPSNCGFDVQHRDKHGEVCPGWPPFFRTRHAGAALKNVALRVQTNDAKGAPEVFSQRGEFVVTQTGVEGSLIYAASAPIREQINQQGQALVYLDLLPMYTAAHVAAEVARPRGTRSLSTHLKARLGLADVKAALLYEVLTKERLVHADVLAAAIKALPLKLVAARPIDEAISTAGGVRFEAMNSMGMLLGLPGVFCAGEMLDWEAPTGGYLLTACMATGQQAARGAMQYLGRPGHEQGFRALFDE